MFYFFFATSFVNMCPQRTGSQASKLGQLQKSHVNTCLARPTGEKVVESAREEAEVPKKPPQEVN